MNVNYALKRAHHCKTFAGIFHLIILNILVNVNINLNHKLMKVDVMC